LWSLKHAAANDEKVRPGLGGASMALMAMGIFGVRALHDSALNSVFLAYQKAGGNRVGCGGGGSSGCGSTAADSGSSCGGGCSGDGGGGCGGGCGGD